MVSFVPSDEQKMIQDTAKDFAEKELTPKARDCDESDSIPQEIIESAWSLGFVNSVIPEAYGGYGMERSAVTNSLLCEELAYGDASMAMAILAPSLFVIPLLEMGTEEQKQKYLPMFCEEKYKPATMAVMEPRVTFDLDDLHTTYVLDGDNYVLNGAKCNVPLAGEADLMLIMAASSKGVGCAGVDAFIVEKGTGGLAVGEREKNMGLKPLATYPVTLTDCTVPRANRLGGDRGINFLRLMNLSKVALSSMAVGVARASKDYAVNYAKERFAFGEPIASRQAIAFMLAEMAWETDASRMLTWKAAWKADRGEDFTKEAFLAKNYTGDKAMMVTDGGVQVLGGHGYIREHPVEMWFRNGRSFAILEGMTMA
jgi:acyl-CoA dehydrogenase